jgi:hypothetical protein
MSSALSSQKYALLVALLAFIALETKLLGVEGVMDWITLLGKYFIYLLVFIPGIGPPYSHF